MINSAKTLTCILILGGACSILSGLFLMWFTYRYWHVAFEFAVVLFVCAWISFGVGLLMVWIVDGVDQWWNGESDDC